MRELGVPFWGMYLCVRDKGSLRLLEESNILCWEKNACDIGVAGCVLTRGKNGEWRTPISYFCLRWVEGEHGVGRRKVLASTICLYINSCVLHTEMSTVGCLNISLRFLHMEGRTGDSLQFAVGGEQLRFADG